MALKSKRAMPKEPSHRCGIFGMLKRYRYEASSFGTILISALWIVAILAVFAVSVGRQSAISLKLTSYGVDKLKAHYIARAALMRALAEKDHEYKTGRSTTIDALSQRWANNKQLFDRRKFGDGVYTVSYEFSETLSAEENPKLYGLMDEQSKININSAPKETMANLIESFDVNRDKAEEIAAAIIDWRDEDDVVTTADTDNFNGAEDGYYRELIPPYHCKNSSFDTIYELILVKGLSTDIFNKIKDYITVYGSGRVNINTASERVLDALFGPDFPDLGSKIVLYRQGGDEIIGTEDDRWFSIGSYIIERGEEGLVEIKNLQEATWYANIYGVSTEEYNRIRELITSIDAAQLCVSSKAYRVIAQGTVRNVKARVNAVYIFEEPPAPAKVKLWYQE